MLFSNEHRIPIVAVSDAGGKFLFEKVPPGDYSFNVNHARFTPVDDKGAYTSLGSRRVSVSEGQVLKGIVFKMMPGAVITGRILDEYGDPQPRASVSIQRYIFMQGKKQLMPFSGASSDDRGEYRIFNIAPGRYYLSVQHEEERWARTAPGSQSDEAYPKVYYPGVLEAETAMSLELHAGEERQGMDMRLIRDRAVRLKGRVMEAGKPARDSVVMMMQKGSSDFRAVKNQPVDPNSGEFDFSGIRPGTYTISAMKMGGPRDRLQGRTEVQVGASNVEGVIVTLARGVTIPGQVVLEGDNAASVALGEKTIRVFLESAERGPSFGGGGRGAVNADGSFELEDVADGTYRLRMRPVPDGGYIAGVQFGDLDVTGKEINVAAGAQGPFKVRIRLSAGTLTGVVKNDKGQAAPNVRVVVAPEISKRDQQELFSAQSTDQYGSFSVKNLAPGEYRVWALSKLEGEQHMDPDFLATIEKQGEKLEVDEKGSYTLDLKLIEIPEGR